MKKFLPYILILIVLVGLFSAVNIARAEPCIGPSTPAGCAETQSCINPAYPLLKLFTVNGQCPIGSTPIKTTTPTPTPTPTTTTTTKPPVQTCDYEKAKAANPVPPDKCKQNSDLDKGLVQCGRKIVCEYQITTNKDGSCFVNKEVIIRTTDPKDSCNFDDMMHLVNNIIKFILFGLAIPVAGIMFAYAGFTLITAGGDNAGARTKAKGIFFSAAIGLVLAFTAYLIIMFILKTLGYNGTWIGF